MFLDKIHRAPRFWSNSELKKFAYLFEGNIVNVSAWKDEDKEGNSYSDYFTNKKTYTITNFLSERRGFQGRADEIFLDLEGELPSSLIGKFDVVFNHTTLEHIFNFEFAFKNLCKLSKDIVILVVPFLQQMHSDYGDFWRFSPQAIVKLFQINSYDIAYLSFNNQRNTSVYIFVIATKQKRRWLGKFPFDYSFIDSDFVGLDEPYAGCNIFGKKLSNFIALTLTKCKRKLKK